MSLVAAARDTQHLVEPLLHRFQQPATMAVALAIDPLIGLKYMQVSICVVLAGQYTRGMLVYGDDIYTGHPRAAGQRRFFVSRPTQQDLRLWFSQRLRRKRVGRCLQAHVSRTAMRTARHATLTSQLLLRSVPLCAVMATERVRRAALG